MKKKKVLIEGYFEIVEEKHESVEKLPKQKKEACKKLASEYEKSMNFEIGISIKNKWVVNYLVITEDLKVGREILKTFINRIEFIFNSRTKQVSRKESVIYG